MRKSIYLVLNISHKYWQVVLSVLLCHNLTLLYLRRCLKAEGEGTFSLLLLLMPSRMDGMLDVVASHLGPQWQGPHPEGGKTWPPTQPPIPICYMRKKYTSVQSPGWLSYSLTNNFPGSLTLLVALVGQLLMIHEEEQLSRTRTSQVLM